MIHDVFHISLLKHNITKKKQVDKIITQFEFKASSKKYKIKEIWNNTIYIKKLETKSHPPGLYYLVLWKNYFKKKHLGPYFSYTASSKAD